MILPDKEPVNAFCIVIKVRPVDIDGLDHVNNVVYLPPLPFPTLAQASACALLC